MACIIRSSEGQKFRPYYMALWNCAYLLPIGGHLITACKLREKHGCPPLTLDSKLTKDAQEYAEFLAKVECFVHSSGDHGENMSLRVGFGKLNITGEEVTNLWYREIENYKYGDNVQMECGHFTQVVWKDTKKAGFGRAYTKDGRKIYVVGRYYPPGNYQGCCKLNVPRPIS